MGYVREIFHFKVTQLLLWDKEKILGFVTSLGGLCISFSIFFHFCLQASPNVSMYESTFTWNWHNCGGRVFCVSAYREWCYQLGMPGTVTWALTYHLWQPPQTFCCPEPLLWRDWPLRFLLWLQDAPQHQVSGNFGKTRFITHRSWSPHSKIMGRERVCGPGVLPLSALISGSLGFWQSI